MRFLSVQVVFGTFSADRTPGTLDGVPLYSFTRYFETQVLRKRPYLCREWCVHVIENAARVEVQASGRVRFWAPVAQLGGRYLRVVTLEDKVTIHNAFPDRGFRS